MRENGLHFDCIRLFGDLLLGGIDPHFDIGRRLQYFRDCASNVGGRMITSAFETAGNFLQPLAVPPDVVGNLSGQDFERAQHLVVRLLLAIEGGEREQEPVRIREAIAYFFPLF